MLILHIGAGRHLPNKPYKTLIRRALATGNLADCVQTIEASDLTNTGYGAALNYIGKVECDASEIRANIARSLVGIDDAICPSSRLAQVYNWCDEFYHHNPHGLTEPVSLNYTALKQLTKFDEENAVSERALRLYNSWRDRIWASPTPTDTIAVASIDGPNTHVVTSSGGNYFKLPGRIGCAGIIGAAIDFRQTHLHYVTCMCSGNGEDIITMKLARHIVSNLQPDAEDLAGEVHSLIRAHSSRYSLRAVDASGEPIVYVGVLVVVQTKERAVLVYCHSTETFYFGCGDRVVLSRLEDERRAGRVFAYGEMKVNEPRRTERSEVSSEVSERGESAR